MRDSGGDQALRVALLSPCYWPEVRRGGERFVRELADGLIARGHAASLITSHPGLPRHTVEDGLSVLRLPRPPQGRLLRRHYQPYVTHVPLSYLALLAGSYQVAHAVYPTDAVAATWWKRRTGRPALLSYLGVPDRKGLREYRRGLELMLRAVNDCDVVVALSEYAAAAFEKWLGYQAPVIPPGVNLGVFKPLAERAAVPTIVCSAAADVPRKNVGLLVQAFELVRAELPDAQLVLSRPRGAVPRSIARPGVHWLDLDDQGELARAYGQAWVAALPSVDEAFGLVLVEALACGTPVVGYDDGAIPEVVDREEIGRLFSRLEPRAFADKLLEAIELAQDPHIVGRCREHAERFSTDRFSERYVALYRQLL